MYKMEYFVPGWSRIAYKCVIHIQAISSNRKEDIEETLLWVTFSSASYADLMLNWVAHVDKLQVSVDKAHWV